MRIKHSILSLVMRMAPVLLVSVFMLPLSARAEIKAGSVELTPFVGYNFFEHRQNLEHQPLVGGRLGYNFTEHLGIEGTWEFMKSYVKDKSINATMEGQFASPINDVSITQFHADLIYHFLPETRFNPYIVGGYGVVHYSPKINNKNMSVINYGVGAKFWVADHVALRADVRNNMIVDETIHSLEGTLGVVFAFGGKSANQPTPVDSDGDGVLNPADKCPGTPAGVAVDRDGCPLDSDGDLVPNYLDKCPNTPAGVTVDKDGCPLDSDGDGVPDYLDKCPGTPAGVKVDKDGCPPVVEKVVILASEPKNDEQVVAAVAQTVVREKVIILAFEDVHFDFDQSTLKPEAKQILKRNVQTLKDNPRAKVRIAGYTSASGTREYNQKLSERRAAAVEEYLISEGVIKPGRLTTIGYGETHPAEYEAAPSDLYSDAAKANIRVLFEIIVQ
ncbi:MAG: outer membrane beta-barrel domain-containing protein [Geobacteraceae bacterium]|nr:outer membrane beta-barrel domain-containing protein [Geobacteraceae bacterium]